MVIVDRPLFFFDCETGGLDPAESDMVELAWITTDPTGRKEYTRQSYKVFPSKPVDPRAAAVNGYSPERWAKEARYLSEVLGWLVHDSTDSVFVSHNTPFDQSFLKPALATHGRTWKGDYHSIDTVTLAWPFVKVLGWDKVRLEVVAPHLGIINPAPHTAMGDVETCRAVYLKLMDRLMVIS